MDPFAPILGDSSAARSMRRFGRRAAAVEAPVLLTGESGTGKGLLARAIHDAGPRARAPFVPVNCAGVPGTLFESEFFGHAKGAFSGAHQSHRGLFEQADGGTLFLDELGALPSAHQAKLLTALEDGRIRRVGAERARSVDARIIAATNTNLEAAVGEGRFRRDLYHRLLVLSFRLPPLRDRGRDLDRLVHIFLARAADRHRLPARDLSPAALDRLRAHRWPGNVRELAHAVEAAVLACDTRRVDLAHLPRRITRTPRDPDAEPAARYSFYGSSDEERRHIEAILHRFRGNKTRAARALGMARNTLRAKIRALDIRDP